MYKSMLKPSIIKGDCEVVLKEFPDNYFDLIITSPPYADSRKDIYGGPSPDEYVDWFLPKSKEFFRVLKPRGTFILNVKEKVVNGERHTYVIDLIKAMKDQGWLWTEEFIWYKKNCYPGKWKNRFRDAWERCLQFNKEKNFKMYQDMVKVPVGDWVEKRFKNGVKNYDIVRSESAVGSGFGRKVANWKNKRKVYPSNVLQLPTECANRNHAAAYPLALPEWFINLFTRPGNSVLDPFAGSGTTGLAAKNLNRRFVLIDIYKKYCNLAKERIGDY